MKTLNLSALVIVLAAFLSCGCASVVSKSNWPVSFNSTPQGANIIIKDKTGNEIDSGVTPVTLTLKSSSGFFNGATYYVEFDLKDYQPVKRGLNSSVNGWYFGNIFLGGFGLIGAVFIDPATGAMYKLPPEMDANMSSASVTFTNSTKSESNSNQHVVARH